MEKKRSKGVTFWGWVYIVFSIIGLLGAVNPQQQIKLFGIGFFLFGIVLCAANLICGIFILKLNETARKAAILLGIVSIILIPIELKPALNYKNNEDYYTKRKQQIIEQVKPEYQQKALVDLEKMKETGKKILPIFLIVFVGFPLLIFEALPIYFFTRPKVKEQFKQS